MRPRTTRTRCAIVVVSSLGWTVTHAETFAYGVDAGVGETDNIGLAHDNKVSQTIAITDVDFDYVETGKRLDVSALGKFSYLDYLQNAYGSQLVGRFDGNAELALVPQQLTWDFQDDYGQAALDPFTPTTPNNLENINYVATGPNLHLRLNGSSFVDASARVAETHYETSPFSNTRGIGSLAWGLKLSALSSVSINVASERVMFENTALNPDFDITNVFVRYEVQAARTQLSADLGDTVVGESGKSTSGALAKVSLVRKLSAAARISFTVGRDTTDASGSFSGIQPGATGSIGAAAAPNVSQSYSRDYGSVGWEYQRNRTILALSGYWEKDDYASDAAFNRTMTTGELRLSRQLRQAFTVQITGRLYKTNYANVDLPAASGSPETQTSSLNAALEWRHGRGLVLKLALEHSSYATSPSGTGYKENRVFLTVGYRPYRGATVGGSAPGAGYGPSIAPP